MIEDYNITDLEEILLPILYKAIDNLDKRTDIIVPGVSKDYTVGQYELAKEILESLGYDVC